MNPHVKKKLYEYQEKTREKAPFFFLPQISRRKHLLYFWPYPTNNNNNH